MSRASRRSSGCVLSAGWVEGVGGGEGGCDFLPSSYSPLPSYNALRVKGGLLNPHYFNPRPYSPPSLLGV